MLLRLWMVVTGRTRAGRVADHGLHRVRLSAAGRSGTGGGCASATASTSGPRQRHRNRRPLTVDRSPPASRAGCCMMRGVSSDECRSCHVPFAPSVRHDLARAVRGRRVRVASPAARPERRPRRARLCVRAGVRQARPLALAPLALLAAAAWGVMPERPRAVRIAAHVVFAAVAIALSLHLIPGFHNPRVIGPTRFTPDAVPFTMYLNLDKPLVGLWLCGCCRGSPPTSRCRALRTGAVAAVATAAACPGALAIGLVGWAPVAAVGLAVAREQPADRDARRGSAVPRLRAGRLTRARSRGPWAALAIGAVLFGAAHAPAAGNGSCSARWPASATASPGGAAGCSRPRSRMRG